MKKLHILIPSLLATVGMSLISLAGCGGESEPTITHTVTFLPGEHGTLTGTTVFTVEGNETKLSYLTKPTIKSNPAWHFKRWDVADDTIIDRDINVKALYEQNPGEVGIDLNIDESMKDEEQWYPGILSKMFSIDTTKIYYFSINTSVCQSITSWEGMISKSFFEIYEENTNDCPEIEYHQVTVRGVDFIRTSTKQPEEGKYRVTEGFGVILNDYQLIDSKLTILIKLKFVDDSPSTYVARWEMAN